MSVKKPLGLGLLIGLMAMAFGVLPAMASAAPQLTNPNGTSVAVGTTLTATSTNATTKFPGLGVTLTCEKVAVHGIVTKNNGTEVEVSMDETGTDTATGCKINGKTSVEVKPTLTSIKLTAETKTASFDFSVPALSLAESSDATVTYSSPPCAKTIKVAGSVTGGASGEFAAEFTIENTKSEAICVD
jgi:hypothetical protein